MLELLQSKFLIIATDGEGNDYDDHREAIS